MNLELFGLRLKQLMTENDYTIYTLAEKLELSPSSISRYCNGLMKPKSTTVYFMAMLLDVSPDYLKGLTDIRK